jgi:anti-sigma factor RsiW
VNDAQQELDDEILSACHDGELPPTEAEAVRRRLAREPELAARLHAMQCVDAAAAGALRAQDRRPLPERTLELLAKAEREDETRRATANVVLLRKASAAGGTSRRRRGFATAAGIVSAFRRLRAQFIGRSR